MRKWLVAVSVAFLMMVSTLVFVTDAQAGGSEIGEFPDREFDVWKYRSDNSYSTEITPHFDGEWWVQLVWITGGSVTVTVKEVDAAGERTLFSSRLTTVGLESTHGYVYAGSSYVVSFWIQGSQGTGARLQEHFVADTPPQPPGWQDPVLLQSMAEYEQAGSVGMDRDGNAMVIWEQPLEGNSSTESIGIWWNRYDAESGWGEAAKLWDGDFWCGYTTLGVGLNGQAVASWAAQTPPYNCALYVSLFDPASGWGAPEMLQGSYDGSYGYMDADIVDSNVTVIVVSHPGQVLTAWRHAYGQGWQSDIIVSGGVSYPKFRYWPIGWGIAVWDDYNTNQVKSSEYDPGYGWGPVKIASGSVGGYRVEMDVDRGGHCLAVFFKSNGTAWEMYGNLYSIATDTWGTPTRIGPAENGWHPSRGDVTADGQGNFFVIWEQSSSRLGGEGSVWSRTFSLDTGWSPAVRLSSGTSTDTWMLPCIAANWYGEVIASWTQNDGTIQNVFAVHFTPGTGWGTPVVIDSSDEFRAYLSQVAIAPDGDSVAIWRQSNGTDDLLWGRIYLAGVSA